MEQTENKRVYTGAQRWLLIGALAIGAAFDIGWRTGSASPAYPFLYGAFWLVYLAVFYLLNWNRAGMRADGAGEASPLCRSRIALSIAIPAALLCMLDGFQWDAPELWGLNIVAIPLLLMVHMAFATREIPVGREWTAVGVCVRGFFVQPFSAVPRFFGAAGSFRRSGDGGKRRGVWIGLLAGIPLAAGVLALLISADPGMGRLLGGLLDRRELGTAVAHALTVLVVAMLFYSFLYNTAWGEKRPLPAPAARDWPVSAFLTVMGLLAAVYALFAYVQFQYLFGGRLPETLTYSRYAREGFGQLMAVSAVNFAVLGISLKKAPRTRALTVMSGMILFSNALLLFSAAVRLLLYIGAYKLTMMRILPLWLMVYLVALVVLFAVRLVRERTPLTRIAALGLIYWYVALNAPQWAGVIAAYNSVP